MKRLSTIIGVLLAVMTATGAFGAVLLPTPQKMIASDKTLPLNPDKVYAAAALKNEDPRVLDALLEVFPKLTMTDKAPLPAGSALIKITIAAGAPLKAPECAPLQCPKEGRGPQSYLLSITGVGESALVTIAADTAHGAFYAVKTLKQLAADGALPAVAIYDFPEFEGRGVLEGFYGKAWDDAKRLEMMRWMADYKFNHYLYAPKDDPMIRMSWRNKYSAKQLEEIRVTSETAHKNFIQYCWELSPGINVNFARDKDYETTLRKFRSVIAQGVDCVVLAFDDVGTKLTPFDTQSGKYKTYWEGQVDFSNRLIAGLLAESPGLRVAFVPNDYWGSLAPTSDYLKYLGPHLDPRYHVGWTGDKIIPKTVTADDARFYETYIKRKPILGDNYPVTDNVNMGGRISLGPLRGRDPGLHCCIAGYSANAMPIPYTSKPALLTIADYTWNPYAYAPDISWVNSWKRLAGEKNYEPFLFFARQNESSFIWNQEALELTEASRSFWQAWDGAPDYDFNTSADALNELFKRFSGIDKELDAAKNDETAAILDEMKNWVDKLADYGQTGQKALALLREKKSGKEVDEEKIKEIETLAAAAEKNRAVVAKVIMPNFFARAAAALRGQKPPAEIPFKTIMSEE